MVKKLFTLSLLLALALNSLHSQLPETFSYQAIARDQQGMLLGNQNLNIRIGILQNGILVWQEEHAVLTNDHGFFTVDIGGDDATGKTGTADSFADVDWGSGDAQLQVSVDAGSGFEELGTNDFHAVPYALYAINGPGASGGDSQELSLEGNQLTISGGNSVDLSPVAGGDGQWTDEQDTLSTLKYVGIGTSNPNQSSLAVQGYNLHPETPLFEVRREDGFPVFAVYNDGVMVYVDEEAKGIRGGFAVGGYSRKSKGLNQEYLTVSPDSVRIYVPEAEQAKGIRGGFAVGGYSRKTKGASQDYLTVTPDSTRVYVPNKSNDPDFVGLQGGFAVSGFTEGSKGPSDYLMGINQGITRFNTSDNDRGFAIGSQGDGWGSNYLELTPTNSFIGFDAGINNREIDPLDENGWGLSSMNVFVGYQSGLSNEWGHHNTFLGYRTGTHTLGDETEPNFAAHNTFIGTEAGFNNTQGSYNVFLGCFSGYENLEGLQNVFVGGNAGLSGVDTYLATMVGNNAGASYTGEGVVSFFGAYAGNNSTGTGNTYLGNNSGGNSGEGNYNVAAGYRSGQFSTGSRNVLIGMEAGRGSSGNSVFEDNTLVGYRSGNGLTTGNYNSFFGAYSGQVADDGDYNSSHGSGSALSLTSGDGNTFMGADAGRELTTASYNVFLGHSAGHSNTTGGNNTLLGTYAGYYNSTGEGNVFLGFAAGMNSEGNNQLFIDNSSADYPLIYGNFFDDFIDINGDLYVWGTLYEYSDVNSKTNIAPLESSLDKVMNLNGVSFQWAAKEGDKASVKGAPTDKGIHIGVIAQQVEEILPSLVRESRSGEKAVNYSGLVPVLLEAIKEQQGQIELLEQRIAELEQ